MLPPLDDLPSKYRTPSQRAYSDEERTCRSSGTSSPTSFGGVCTCFHCSISIGTKGSGINFHHRLNCQLQLTPSLSSKLIRLLLQRRTPWTAYVAGKICSALYCEFSWRRDEAILVSPEHFSCGAWHLCHHAVRYVDDRSDFRIGDSRSASRRTAGSAGRSAISFWNSVPAYAASLSSME